MTRHRKMLQCPCFGAPVLRLARRAEGIDEHSVSGLGMTAREHSVRDRIRYACAPRRRETGEARDALPQRFGNGKGSLRFQHCERSEEAPCRGVWFGANDRSPARGDEIVELHRKTVSKRDAAV